MTFLGKTGQFASASLHNVTTISDSIKMSLFIRG
ncbi:hypothetical protein CWC36_02985 [Staphylococcus epidermidis]|uniref:Uncharacterized protein n=1 Tax=Staphylococcus epidermidis (strain ATCC 12228 / FDA PCI 1200) TaxID=176280 RepID=A0A0H2VER1_STAES|nr:hypothetical protein SE_0333 [Staphylococcus epidermidis ATCC 12228]AVA11298.1 hypothetical protein AL514_06835 [Staphylococcus epidermidis]PJM39570.1 hypothetical protein CWC35_08505 [Staphylococcus epidermidis]PJM50595.1 hypothetical protein CWB53_10770 [Staphylococcus epidermidis]PJM54049.1 hypothetical protein CWB54_06225 [Staphylococcus epidermidis]